MTLWKWTAAEIAEAIRLKRVSCREVVQAHLDRIEAVNATVNAVTLVLAEEALAAAEAADAAIAAEAAVGPLHGVPITIKENVDLAGSATTQGLPSLKDAVPERDAPVVAHLKRAGAIPIGRTNLPDYALRWHTDNALWGATLNPWHPGLTPGGSSGGDAAALATGMTPLGLGNDMGGSVRYPAQCCAVLGIRPSLGRASSICTALFPYSPTFYEQVASVNGPMARTVRDLRLALEAMSPRDPADPWWLPAPWLGTDRPKPIRVAVTYDAAGAGIDPAVAEGVRKAADALEAAGYAVEERDPPELERTSEVIQRISNEEIRGYLPDILPDISVDARAMLEGMLDQQSAGLADYIAAIGERHRIARLWSLFMEDCPLVLGPVSTWAPFVVGFDLGGREEVQRFIRSIALTEACNLLGLPALALPVGVADGVPQGVQLVAPLFHEPLCFEAAEAIEQALGTFTPIEPRAAPDSSAP